MGLLGMRVELWDGGAIGDEGGAIGDEGGAMEMRVGYWR